MVKFSIIIPSYTNYSGLIKCLDSIVAHTDLSETEILVIANGAPEETRRVYNDYPVTLIWFAEACGYTHACNVGIAESMGSHIILLNDDTIVLGANWISLLYAPFIDDPLMALSGPLKLTCPEANRDFLVFFCVMMSRAAIDALGPLDEIFNPGYGEDCDWTLRAVDAGWKIQQVPPEQATLIDKGCEDLPEWKRAKMWHNSYPLYHAGNETFGKDPKFEGLIKRNSAILTERYGPKVNTPSGACSKCGGEAVDGVCIGGENRPNCNGLYLWRAAVIDGWFGVDEMAFVAAQAKALAPNSTVVSIGEWHGRSGRAIADNLSEGSIMYAIDTWTGSSGEPEMHGTAHYDRGDHAHQYWWCNMHSHIVAGRVIPVRMHSENAAHTFKHLGVIADFVFIDGDHSEEGIKTDVEAWLPLLNQGGMMCGHDYYKENEGPYWVHVRQYVERKFPQVEKSATSVWHVRPHEQKRGAAHVWMNDQGRFVVDGEMLPVIYVPPSRLLQGTTIEFGGQKRGNVYDCFIFSNEQDLLELRLATLNDVVDRFVIVEGTIYHNGKPKPLFFEDNLDRFQPYLHKITHIVVDDWPEVSGSIYDNAWARERWQRDAILRGLTDCQPNDIIILGDADEIANPETVASYNIEQGLCRLKQRMFYYYLNCENKEGWDWQKIAPYWLVKQLSPCGIRYPPAGDTPLLEKGGWHFSMLGGSEAVKHKLSTYSHQEFNRPEILDGVEAAIVEGRDIFGRDLKYEFVEVDESYPEYVRHNCTKYARLVRDDHWVCTDSSCPYNLIAPDHRLVVCDKWQRDVAIKAGVRLGAKKPWTVTAEVSTLNRYTTTLPLTLAAIITQTRKPDKLIIYDDGEQADLREMSPFKGLFQMCDERGIKWEIFATPRKGQVTNHQHALDTATTDFIWRVDDDLIPMPDCLERLLNTVRDHGRGGDIDNIGAVAPLIHHAGNVQPLPAFINGSISDLQAGLHLQWFDWNGGDREVEHLYSSFLYSTSAARKAGGYPKDLSPIGHREESWFSMKIRMAGYKLLVDPRAKAFHLRESTGGIRSYNDPSLWEHDEALFQAWLKSVGSDISRQQKVAVLDCGIGDHWVFRSLLPRFIEKYGRPLLAVCYPEVFEGQDVDLMSIADAKLRYGDNLDQFNAYKFAWEKNHSGPIAEAFKEFYGL